jgi:ABC-type phosphate transport system ATPase subunit
VIEAISEQASLGALADARLAIVAKNVTVSYAEAVVLDNVSFRIPGHCLTAILGPSGCGTLNIKDHVNVVFKKDTDTIH